MWVFVAFLVSCTLMTAASWMVAIDPRSYAEGPRRADGARHLRQELYRPEPGIRVVHGRACFPDHHTAAGREVRQALLLTLVAANFVVNMVFVVVSRTALVTLPVMLAVFAMAHLKWRTNVLLVVAAVVFGALAWTVSPQLQATTDKFTRDYRIYKELNQPTSIGLRLEFWEKSLRFFAEAPVIGHGTGIDAGAVRGARRPGPQCWRRRR
mgnify:CR=1 FL=1